ncbi:Ctf8-domain-containing protein [Cristinia sonorae]|uniref:Ctf8-domain-containing protein n=1 Tax=Cristinia sonorae TaxID=1940300 RepID=A0A8K0UQ91_9AGAR|nr:Ctf8-domain-containing protein [Cristinia sonorae]
MIIPININASSSSTGPLPPQLAQFGTDELVLIEMQGTLEVEGSKAGQAVGKLTVDEKTKKPTLRIGHHLLEGKLVNLPKPLAVLHRPPRPLSNDDDETDIGGERDWSGAQKTQVEWDVVAVVRKKMVFSKRPMPMVASIPVAPGGSVVKKAG